MLADQGGDARIDKGFEINIINGGEGEVKDIEGGRTDGGEVSVEED